MKVYSIDELFDLKKGVKPIFRMARSGGMGEEEKASKKKESDESGETTPKQERMRELAERRREENTDNISKARTSGAKDIKARKKRAPWKVIEQGGRRYFLKRKSKKDESYLYGERPFAVGNYRKI